MNGSLVIFDLDGTLADTAPDLVATLNRITAPHNLPPVVAGDLGSLIGQGAKAMIQKKFKSAQVNLSAGQLDDLFDEFLIDYAANIAVETRLFEGLLEAMDVLQSDGCSFAICTNKTERLARKLIAELELSERFLAITGGDTFAFRKPDGRHILETIRLAGGSPGKSVMIGDSAADIEGARDANIASIAVTFGYSDQPAHTLGADRTIDHFHTLSATVRELLSAGAE